MLIIRRDFHTRYQQIAMANGESGELFLEQRLAFGASQKLLGRVARATRLYRSHQSEVSEAEEAKT